MPGRAWYWGEDTSPGSLIGRHAAQYPAVARPLDPVTARHLGKWLPAEAAAYAGKVLVMPGCPGADTPPDGPGGGVSPHGGGWTPAPGRDVVHISRHPGYQPEPGTPKEPAMTASMWEDTDDAPDTDPDTDQALAAVMDDDLNAPVDGISLEFDSDSDVARFDGGDPEPVEQLDADQARDRVMAALEQVISRNGKAVIGDLAHLPEQLGRSRPWLYYTLDQLTLSRALTRKTGQDGTSWTFTRRARVPAGVSGSDT
jgi:hypothetical protein